MRDFKFVLVMFMLFSGICFGQESIFEREALLGDGYGFRNYLNDSGLTLDVSVVGVYQSNVKGGLSTHNRRGEFSGRYDLELDIDSEKILGWENSHFYMDARGSWTDTGGIDGTSIGSAFGVNGIANTDRAMDIIQFWFEKSFDNGLTLRFGKLDLTCGFECKECPVSFDASMYANSECGFGE